MGCKHTIMMTYNHPGLLNFSVRKNNKATLNQSIKAFKNNAPHPRPQNLLLGMMEDRSLWLESPASGLPF